MGLLAPLFLLGLAAVAVPVIIHMRLRHRSRMVPFPSLMFISRAPYRSVRRRRLRDLLLLALRCLALALLAVAFARPLFQGDAAANAAAANRLTVVLLDNSFSMGFGGRWQRATSAAASAFDGMSAVDRGALIVYSDQAAMVAAPTADGALLATLARETELVPRATSLLPAIQVARGVLADAGSAAARELVIVSDFQRSSWAPDNVAALPQGVELRLVDVRSEEEDEVNAAVTDVVLDHARMPSGGAGAGEAGEGARERVGIAARVSYQGVGAAADPERAPEPLRAEVDLLFDGEVIQTRAVELPLDSSTMVSFAPEVLERERTTRGTVRLREDALATDNEFHFVLSPAHEVGVLVIEPGGDRRRSRYLEEALSLGRRPFLRVNRVQASGFQPAMLEGKSVVVINDSAQQLPAAADAAVVRFVREGGGLLIGVERGLNSTSALLGEFGVESTQQVDRLAGTPGALAWFDTGHPVFDVFAAARSGDFSSASFFRYHRLETPEGAMPIALFDDGAPALLDLMPARAKDGVADAASGRVGRVLVLPTSFDTFWNTLPLQAVFLPFVHRSMEYLAGYALPRSWYRVGEVASVELPGTVGSEGDGYISVAPSGRERRLGTGGGDLLLDVEEPGFYDFREVRADVTSERLTLAANVPVSESDLGGLDVDEFASRIRPDQAEDAAASLATPVTAEEREQRQRLWWYLIAAAATILVAEGLFGNRRRRATAAPVVTAWSPTGEET